MTDDLELEGVRIAQMQAFSFKRRFPSEDIDEIRSDAFYGLAVALNRYNSSMNPESYIWAKVRGNILDGYKKRAANRRAETSIDFLENVAKHADSMLSDLKVAISEIADARNREIMGSLMRSGNLEYTAHEVGLSDGMISRIRAREILKLRKALGLNGQT